MNKNYFSVICTLSFAFKKFFGNIGKFVGMVSSCAFVLAVASAPFFLVLFSNARLVSYGLSGALPYSPVFVFFMFLWLILSLIPLFLAALWCWSALIKQSLGIVKKKEVSVFESFLINPRVFWCLLKGKLAFSVIVFGVLLFTWLPWCLIHFEALSSKDLMGSIFALNSTDLIAGAILFIFPLPFLFVLGIWSTLYGFTVISEQETFFAPAFSKACALLKDNLWKMFMAKLCYNLLQALVVRWYKPLVYMGVGPLFISVLGFVSLLIGIVVMIPVRMLFWAKIYDTVRIAKK